jgi:molecular chaperone DnaK (HSP70)
MNGAALLNHLDPETVIAKGAQIYGQKNSINNYSNLIYEKNCLLDMGFEIEGGFMQVIIPRDTEIPAKRKVMWTIEADY